MSSERTEEATPKRLREARRRGQVARSKELVTGILLIAAGMTLRAVAPGWIDTLRGLSALALRTASAPTPAAILAVGSEAFAAGALAVAPVLGALVAAATLGSVLQTGPVFASEAISFDPQRLDPIAGAQRIVSLRSLIELVRGLVKIGITLAVAYVCLRDAAHGLAGLSGRPADAALQAAGGLGATLLFRVGGAMVAIGILDLLYQRWQLARDQRMTKDEVKREHKDADGDPHVKQQRERMRREIAQHDLLESVRTASVVVVNPTHLAVALRFDETGEQSAPEVVGKGQDELARRMIRAAEEAGVPVMRDVPLARGLFELEVGEEIPERLYDAVAAVLRAAWAEDERGDR
jgi:type III secretion YscU/HrpY family protein